VNTQPLANYMKAIEAYRSGDTKQAELLIANSVGLTEPTDYIKDSLKSLCDIDKPNEAIVTLLFQRLIKEG
jgi:hypothetical protein